MAKAPFNLDREFIRWFYEDIYPTLGQNRCGAMHYKLNDVDWKDHWMREAYRAGAQAMWDDINYTLMSYATAVEGLEYEGITPAEVYDRARESLYYYIHDQLELFDAR